MKSSPIADIQAWRERELILEDGRPLGEVIAPFQRARFDAWDNQRLVYCEACVGSSKTTDLAGWCISQLMIHRHWECFIFAVDREQAEKIVQAARGFVARNPGLREAGIAVGRRHIKNGYTAEVKVESSDVASAEGVLADVVIAEQLESWKSVDLWESIFSRRHKRNMRLFVIANAPLSEEGWVYDVRERARHEEMWSWLNYTADDVPWMNAEYIEEQAKAIRPEAFRRLYYNEPGAPSNPFLTQIQVDAVTDAEGAPVRDLPQGTRRCVLAIDMGLRHDLAALVAVGEDITGRQQLLNCMVWQGSKEREVRFDEVEIAILDWVKALQPQCLIYDPWQMAKSAQDLRSVGVGLHEFRFTEASVDRLTAQLYRRVIDKEIIIYPDAGVSYRKDVKWDLAKELSSVSTKQANLRLKLVTRGSATKDRIIALGMASLYLTEKIHMAPRSANIYELAKEMGIR